MEDQLKNARSYYHNKKDIKFKFSDTSGINLNDKEDSVTQTKTEKVSENPSISSIYGETYSKNKAEQLDSLIKKYKNLKYKDLDMTGVLYAQGKIKIDMGDEVLNITGTITSYGGNPAEEDPGASGKGSIDINAGKLGITYDPTYLNSMLAASKRRKLKKVMYGTY